MAKAIAFTIDVERGRGESKSIYSHGNFREFVILVNKFPGFNEIEKH